LSKHEVPDYDYLEGTLVEALIRTNLDSQLKEEIKELCEADLISQRAGDLLASPEKSNLIESKDNENEQ